MMEMNAARLMRLLKSIPSICMNEEVVKSVSSIPINKRVHFGLGVDLLLTISSKPYFFTNVLDFDYL